MLTQAAQIIIALTIIFGLLSIGAVVLRIYVRLMQKVGIGGDDVCVMIALFLSLGVSVLDDVVAGTSRVGDPSYIPDMKTLIFALKMNFGTENASIAAMGFVKVSFLLFYRRIFITRWFLICNNILVGLVTGFTLAILLTVIFSKWPVSAQWDPLVPYNVNNSAVLVSYCAGNAILDFLTLALPLCSLRGLQMNAHRKLVLATIFILGSVCVFASLIRLYYAVKFVQAPKTPASFFEVPFIYNALWATLEPPIFIITGCIMTYGPLYKAKYGPWTLYRSLRSKLSSKNSSKKSSKGWSASHTQTEVSEGRQCRHGWHVLPLPTEAQKHVDAPYLADWEITDISTLDGGETTRKSSATMV